MSTEGPNRQLDLPDSNNAGSSSLPNNDMSASAAPTGIPEPPRLTGQVSSQGVPTTTAAMTTSSTPLGNINAARKPPTLQRGGSNLTSDIQARMAAFRLGRQGPAPGARGASTPGAPVLNTNGPSTPGVPASPIVGSPSTPLAGPGGVPAGFKLPNGLGGFAGGAGRTPNLQIGGGKKPSLAEKRGLTLPGGLPGQQPAASPAGQPGAPAGGRKKPGLSLSQITGGPTDAPKDETKPTGGTLMDKYADYLDTRTGTLRFAGKAVLSSTGIEFSSGTSFSISLDEVDTLDELGKGNYGTVYKVRHSRPKMRRPGLGLAGNKVMSSREQPMSTSRKSLDGNEESSPQSAKGSSTTGVVMAMKEIRLELDDAKFAAIIMELDILHRCISPFIVDFYGAFFQEGAVYICMEFMDGGSIDKIYGGGIPENILRKITYSTTMGLRCLKDEHNIIHRDVKPTNILMNTRGQIKICDFGVSGNLVASFAKTNIGCQSYMAPERISTGGMGLGASTGTAGTYSVQSDIWSLGLTIIECAMGRYPYPPETYNNIFSQLSAIVDGDPPDLPAGYSELARNFVRGTLNKVAKLRPTYGMLLQHAWLAPLAKPAAIAEEDEDEDDESTESITPATSNSLASSTSSTLQLPPNVVDREVAEWVLGAIERRRAGKLAKSEKPALHAAPLDAVASPVLDKTKGEGVLNGSAVAELDPLSPTGSRV